MKRHPRRSRGERGAALIAVLCFVALVALITASAVTISQVGNYTSRTFTDRSLSSYVAEGAVARMQWLVVADKKKFSNRLMGETDYANETQERYLADGIKHSMDYYGNQVDVAIYDMASGYDISDDNASSRLDAYRSTFYDDAERRDAFMAFQNCIKDYTDADDFTQLKGLEKGEYTSRGLAPLPRNGRMQFREEIMLVPGFSDFFSPDANGRLSTFRIIPPPNMPRISQNSSFFSASREVIMNKCSLSPEQADQVIEARNQWEGSRTPLNQTLEPSVLASLKSNFSFSESGFFTLIVNASPGEGRVRRTLAVSMQIPVNISLPGVRYYEWILY